MSFTAALVPITKEKHDVRLYLAYATDDNFTGKPVGGREGQVLHLAPIRSSSLSQIRSSAYFPLSQITL